MAKLSWRFVLGVSLAACLLTLYATRVSNKYSPQDEEPGVTPIIRNAGVFGDGDRQLPQTRPGDSGESLGRLTAPQTDLPVTYMSDDGLSRAQRESGQNHPRWNPWPMESSNQVLVPEGHHMENVRLADDYRFCVKEAPMEGPFHFTNQSKNPCWYDEDGGLQCMPYFYLAGVSKSGTTDLYARILGHPDIFNDHWKEKHWLDYSRYFKDHDSVSYYAKAFAYFSSIVKKNIDLYGHSDLIVGDGTPCYFFFSLYWHCYHGNRGLTEPKFTNADVIRVMNPRAKIILSMRDPVKRLFSRYMTLLKNNASSPLWFHQSTSRAVDLYTDCIQRWSARHCAYNGTLYGITKTRLQEGMYSIFLRDWLNVFPREQILILKFEDYVRDVPTHVKTIFNFLELAPVSNKSLQSIVGKSRMNVLPKDKGYMMQETIDLLQKFYRPYNLELQQILGDQAWSWGYE